MVHGWMDRRNDILTGKTKARPRRETCAWCLRKEKEVTILLSGPGIWICDECVDMLWEMVQERRAGNA